MNKRNQYYSRADVEKLIKKDIFTWLDNQDEKLAGWFYDKFIEGKSFLGDDELETKDV